MTILAWRADPRADLAAAVDGVLLVGWIAVELAFLRDLSFLHVAYALVGLSLVVWGRHAAVPALRPGVRSRVGRTF